MQVHPRVALDVSMSAARVLSVLALVMIGACGRVGFGDRDARVVDDATLTLDATSASTIAVNVFRITAMVRAPVADATVVVEDGVTTQVIATDATGHAAAVVAGDAAVHVAQHVAVNDTWDIVTYANVPPGTALTVGPVASDETPATQNASVPAPAVPNADTYNARVPPSCTNVVSFSPTPRAPLSVYASCLGTALPVVLYATMNQVPLAMQYVTMTPGLTTSITTPWATPITREIAFPAHPRLGFEAMQTWHTDGGYSVKTNGDTGAAVANVASIRVFDTAIDAVEVSYRNVAGDAHVMRVPVGAPVGNRITIDPALSMRTLTSFTRSATNVMTWSYDTATNLRDAHALRIVEFYGNVEHEYYLDPTQLTVARPRLPGALAALYDGANVGKATAALFRLGDTPWAALRPTVNAAFRRLGRGEPAYAFDFRDSN